MTDKKVLGIGGALAIIAGVVLLTRKAKAELPKVYTCPVCDEEFSTLEELQYHFTTFHPREEIPIEWE